MIWFTLYKYKERKTDRERKREGKRERERERERNKEYKEYKGAVIKFINNIINTL